MTASSLFTSISELGEPPATRLLSEGQKVKATNWPWKDHDVAVEGGHAGMDPVRIGDRTRALRVPFPRARTETFHSFKLDRAQRRLISERDGRKEEFHFQSNLWGLRFSS